MAGTGVGSGRGRKGGFAVVAGIVLLAGCASPEAVFHEEAAEGARAPLVMAEVAAVEEFLEGDSRGPVAELLPTGSGIVALFEEGVASFGVDPVVEVWSYEVSGLIHGVAVSSDGESVLVRHEADMGPMSRQRTVELYAGTGSVRDSQDTWGGSVPTEGRLLSGVWVTQGTAGTLVASSLTGGDVVWERNLAEECSSGSAEDVDLVPDGDQLFVSFSCSGDGTAHVAGVSAEAGNVFWEHTWQDASAPRVHVLYKHTVPGSPADPIERMLDEESSGGFLFLRGASRQGFEPVLPQPWPSAPGIVEYVEEPIQDLEVAPQEIVLFSSSLGGLNDAVLVQATRWLAEDDRAPFSREEIDESLLIDGEFVQNPRQWGTGADGYIAPLREELAKAFP